MLFSINKSFIWRKLFDSFFRKKTLRRMASFLRNDVHRSYWGRPQPSRRGQSNSSLSSEEKKKLLILGLSLIVSWIHLNFEFFWSHQFWKLHGPIKYAIFITLSFEKEDLFTLLDLQVNLWGTRNHTIGFANPSDLKEYSLFLN